MWLCFGAVSGCTSRVRRVHVRAKNAVVGLHVLSLFFLPLPAEFTLTAFQTSFAIVTELSGSGAVLGRAAILLYVPTKVFYLGALLCPRQVGLYVCTLAFSFFIAGVMLWSSQARDAVR